MATNKLKEIIVNEGITQTELAKESNLSDGTINKICNKKRTPSPTTMNKIVKALNVLSKNSHDVKNIFPNYTGDGDDDEEI